VESVAAEEYPAPGLTLDDKSTRDAAGFVAGLGTPLVIDEVQRAPDLLFVIKHPSIVIARPMSSG
jgi:hypothetical protein